MMEGWTISNMMDKYVALVVSEIQLIELSVTQANQANPVSS